MPAGRRVGGQNVPREGELAARRQATQRVMLSLLPLTFYSLVFVSVFHTQTGLELSAQSTLTSRDSGHLAVAS